MRTFLRTSAVALLLSLGLSSVSYAAQPALEIKVQSVSQLLANAEYIGGLFGQEEAAKQFKGFIEQTGKPENGVDGLYGIDINKPFGLYAYVEQDIQKSRIMLLIPVTDKEVVLNTMKQMGQLNPEVEEGGYYSVEVPDFPLPVYFRFSDGYLHATIQNRDAMMPNMMLTPAQFFVAKELKSIASVVALIDEVPMDVRKTLFGQLEFNVAEQFRKNSQPGTIEGAAAQLLQDVALSGLNELLMEGKELNLTFDIKPELDEFGLNVTFDAMADTPLKKKLADLESRSSVAGRLSVPKNPLFVEQKNFAFSEAMRPEWAKLVDQVIEKSLADAKDGGERVFLKMAADAIAPTLKAGILDFGIVGTQAEKGVNGVLALRVVKGTEIAKTVQTFSAFADRNDAEFKFKVEEVNGITLHKVTIKEPDFAKVTGTQFLWLGTSDDVILASIEENGDAIRKAAKGDVGSLPIAKTEVSVARLVTSNLNDDDYEQMKAASEVAYGDKGPNGRDTISINVTGGEKLTINLKAKGQLARFFYEVDQQKKQ